MSLNLWLLVRYFWLPEVVWPAAANFSGKLLGHPVRVRISILPFICAGKYTVLLIVESAFNNKQFT